MYCLEKFQRELAYFLDIDLRDLPKVQEILKAQGYTAVKKNDEIIELGSARQSFLEKIPADIAPSTFTKQEIEKLLTQFDNIENLTQHLNTRADSQARQELFHLLESTKNNPNIHYTKDSKDKYLKRFKDNDEHDPYFYLLITKDKDKTFITHLKTRDLNYLEKEILNAESIIKGADIIGDFRQQAGSAKHKSPTSTTDSTTNNLKWQQDGNVLRSVVELDNGEKLLLSKDRLGNVYIQSNFKEQINSYDELMLQESLEKFAKDELENKLARQIETKSLAQEVDSVILSGSEKSHSKKDTSAKPQYDKGEGQGYDKQKIDSSVKVEPINEFGENYPQFYHKPHEAIKHLLETKSGQVQGAFYRDEIGDITLAWGEKGTGKSDGWGLAKIAEYHPEVIDKLDELVQNLPIVKENANRYQLENDMYKLSIRKDFEGQKENWILTAFEKDESIARRRTDLPSSQSEAEKTTSANAKDIIPQTTKEKIGANKTISADESLNALQTFNATDKDIIPQKRNKAGIAKLDSTQIQSQIQKEAKAQQEAADYFAKTQAKRDEIIAIKEAKLGKNADEVPLDKGQDILYKPIRDTSIVLNDESAPFEAEFAVVRLSDIKPNFDNSNTQGRLIKQESVIANIVNDFKPELIFYQEGGVNGVPIITRDGKVVSGNHRSEALKQIFNSQTHNAETAQQKYKQGAKEFLGVELENDEIIVRRLKENMSDKQILQLAFSSNIGRESTMGEKALSTLSLYRQNIATLPKALQSENVNELKSLVAKHIDKQGNGLNTFEPNLALLTSLARNGKNSNILQSLDSIKGNAEYKNKIINMYVDNAGNFYNLAHNPSFKNLEFRDILSDAIFYTAKQNPTRELDYTHLINDIESFLNLAKDKQALKNALVLDSNKVENLTAQAFGVALAKFSRQENPSSALYECLKEAPKALELATQPTFFTQGKALSEVDIYDFLEYLINQGQVTQTQSALSSLMPRLRELRESIANPQSSVSKAETSLESTSQISKEIKDIIDSSPQKGRDMVVIGKENFTPEVVEYAHKNNKKIAIDKLEQAEAEKLGFKYPNDVRVTIDYSAINHTLNRHGAESALVKNSGQKAVDYDLIAEYRSIVKGADETLNSVDNMGTPVVVSYKQINGHFVVIEEIRKGQNELNFKTMFKQDGNYKDSESYKKTSQSSNATEGYEPTANSFASTDDIIPQNSTKAQSEYFNPFMNEYEKIKEIKKLHTQDDNLIRVMKIEGRRDYIEPLSNMGVSKEYLQKQTAQSLKEQITQAILGNQTQLKALQQGYNTYHLSPFQKEVLESALDIANNPAKLKAYKLQGLQKQLDNLNTHEAYHIETGREYDKARYAKDRQELEREIAALKGETSDIVFTDKKGKEHTLTQEVQEQWLKTFNLKSINESYIPKHSDEIREALGGKEIKLQLGSLKKLVAQGREKYIPQIKEVLDSPEVIMRDDMGEYLFIKHLKDDDYFVNVSFDNGEYLVSISNGIKETRNLNNKLEKGGSFIYQSPNFNSISQKLLQTSQYSANKIDSDIIPQTTQEIIKQAKQSGKSVAETKELIRKNKELKSSIKELKIS